MTRQQALTRVVSNLRKAVLCPGCGELEERCKCPQVEWYEFAACKTCTFQDPNCDECEL